MITQGTLFGQSQQLGLNYVLSFSPDRFLAPCFHAAGKESKAACYGGWESRQIQGHLLGHYLSALASFYHAMHSTEAKEKLDYTVSVLKGLQREDGYIGGSPSTPFDTVFSSNGNFAVERFSLSSWWVPWYSIHKIYAGLIDAYLYGKNSDALGIVRRMADWAMRGTQKMSDDDMQKMLTCEHGGMCKVFADLYGITKEKKYLAEAERWIHKEIIEPAMRKEDALQGYHANTQIPKFIGLARLYELTGKTEYKTAVEFFFDTVSKKRSYAIGGNSKGEHFGKAGDETLSRDTTETCNTYNMLELAEHVFDWEKKSEIADFYERALYNHILASQDPDTGAKTYFVALQRGAFKVYCSHDNSMWCCTGTGLENPSRYNRFIARDYADELYINLFIDSTVTTADGWELRIETDFPYSQDVKIRVLKTGTAAKRLFVRSPTWCEALQSMSEKNGYIDFGELKADTAIKLTLAMKLWIRQAQDNSGNFTVFYGAIVLAADLGADNLPPDIVEDHLVYLNTADSPRVEPITADLSSVEKWITLTDKKTLTFTMSGESNKKGVSYTLKPFFSLHHTRYAVYFSSIEEETEAEKEGIDVIEAARQQSEIEHNFKSEGTSIGYLASVDRNYRSFDSEQSALCYEAKFDTKAEKNRIVLATYAKESGIFRVDFDGKEEKELAFSATGKDEIQELIFDVPQNLLHADAASGQFIRKVLTIRANKGAKLIEVRILNR